MSTLTLLFCVSAPAAAAEQWQGMIDVTKKAIINYFQNSDREIQTVKLGKVTHLSSSARSYLVEADVQADSPAGEGQMMYHCGVFVKRVGAKSWESQYTECEGYSNVLRPRN